MPNIKSAKKRVKTSEKKSVVNTLVKSSMKTAIKNVEKAVKASDKEVAAKNLTVASKKIDKALSSGVVKDNKAARDKSRLTKIVNKMN
ncbi:MAG: 30S ribosomal protein S20 [Bacilli bacterium]